MAKITKRQKEIRSLVSTTEKYDILSALDLLQNKLPKAKFIESIDVSINLGVDPKKSDQVVRGACVLPHGTGKTVRVAVFTQGDKADQAKAAGADIVGFKDLADAIKEGKIDFDVLIATPDAMAEVGKLGQILGPKGLMPNPKIGTVTPDVSNAVKQAKAGQVRFRADKAGIVQASCGKINFTPEQLKENIETLVTALRRLKPATAKGVYIKKITVSTTMGAGLVLNHGSLAA